MKQLIKNIVLLVAMAVVWSVTATFSASTNGILQFSAAAYSVNEDAGPATITVLRTRGSGPVTVHYATSDGTATAGTDYTLSAGTLTFGARETRKTFTVPLTNDALVNGLRTVHLTLSAPTGGAVLGAHSTAVLTILDDDRGGVVQFGAPAYRVQEGAGTATLTVVRTEGRAGGVTVAYATSNGTATAGADYTATSGTLAFAAGESRHTVTIPIATDALIEGEETLRVTLSSPGGGAVLGGQRTAVLTIVDDDAAVQFSQPRYRVGETGGHATVTVERVGGTAGTVTVPYATSPGTAIADLNYTAVAGTLTFAAGVRSRTFTVPVLADGQVTADKTVTLTLGPPTGASLGTPSTAVLTIVNTDSSSGPVITGTAAAGAPLASRLIRIKDKLGAKRTGIIDSRGKYTFNVTGLTPQFLLKVEPPTITGAAPSAMPVWAATDPNATPHFTHASLNGASEVDGSAVRAMPVAFVDPGTAPLFSVCTQEGVCNVHPFTDLIIRTWYEVQGTTVEAVFDAPTIEPPAPTADQIVVIASLVRDMLHIWLVANGLDPKTFDLINTAFDANGTGFDRVLELARIDVQGTTRTITLNDPNPDKPLTQTTALSVVNKILTGDTKTCKGNTQTCTAQEASSASITLAVVPTDPAVAAALSGLVEFGKQFAAVLKNKGYQLTDQDLLPFFDANYLDDGFGRNFEAANFATGLRASTLDAVLVDRVLSFDATTKVITIHLIVTLTQNGVTRQEVVNGVRGLSFKQQADGSWKFFGNQRIAEAQVLASIQDVRQGDPSDRPQKNFRLAVAAPLNTVASASVTGTDGTNKTLTKSMVTRQDILHPTPTTTLSVTFDVFADPNDSGRVENFPPLGTEYTFAITPVSGNPVAYTDVLRVSSDDAITITNLMGHTLADAHLGEPLRVVWTLPATFPIERVSLSGSVVAMEVFIDENGVVPDPTDPIMLQFSGRSCSVESDLPLAPNSTSGTITLPATCEDHSVQTADIFVVVHGVHGEETRTAWFFNQVAPPGTLPLRVRIEGRGRVTGLGIACPGDCTEGYAPGTASVTLTATPTDAAAIFWGWGGACASAGRAPTCTVLLPITPEIDATVAFRPALLFDRLFVLDFEDVPVGSSRDVDVTVRNNGGRTLSGTITVGGGSAFSLVRPTSYSLAPNQTTTVTVRFRPAAGLAFNNGFLKLIGDGGNTLGLTGRGSPVFSLQVNTAGTGLGTISLSPSQFRCFTSCFGEYTSGTVVTITATPASGSAFTGWSGACSETGTCTVTMNANKSVTATFTSPAFTLTVTKVGTGSGTIISIPPGITCSSGTCTANFVSGAVVTLTASPSGGSTFAGWSGACTNTTGTCTVTMNAAKSVTATFGPVFTLTVTKAGTGSGTITSSPPGISCTSGTCPANFVSGTVVALTATPGSTATFAGWSGACTNTTGTCTVTINSAKSVTATFTALPTFTLSVTKAGTGSGTITSNPAGIDCSSGTCPANFVSGTTVTLTASPAGGSTFAGWSGACTNATGICTVTMTAPRAVSAGFRIPETGNELALDGADDVAVEEPVSSPSVLDLTTLTIEAWVFPTSRDFMVIAANDAYSLEVLFDEVRFTIFTDICCFSVNFAGVARPLTVNQWNHVVAMVDDATKTIRVGINGELSGPVTYDGALSDFSQPFSVGGVAPGFGGFGFFRGRIDEVRLSRGVRYTGNFEPQNVFTADADMVALWHFDEPEGSTTFADASGNGHNLIGVNGAATAAGVRSREPVVLSIGKLFGSGTVTSSPTGLNCGPTCTGVFASGAVVTLSVEPRSGFAFSGWTGCNTVNGFACTVTMTATRTVTASFTNGFCPVPLPKSSGSRESGSLTDSDCEAPHRPQSKGDLYTFGGTAGQVVTIALDSTDFDPYLVLVGPTGLVVAENDDLVGLNARIVNVTLPTTGTYTIEATAFRAENRGAYTLALALSSGAASSVALTVSKAGTGNGSLTIISSGTLDCGGGCIVIFPTGTRVTLTASAGSGSAFAGWIGDCTGLGTCTVTMDAPKWVTAAFTANAFTLTVTKEGSGSGAVTSQPGGISCGSDCVKVYPSGTFVTLTAAPASGSTFVGWSGVCAGTGDCVVSLERDETITASFIKPVPPDTWTPTGQLTDGRVRHTATLLTAGPHAGTVLVAGGLGSNTGNALATAEFYDPSTGLWRKTGSMSEARYIHTATRLPNGKVLVAGGFSATFDPLATAELYDPATGIWTPTGSMRDSRMNPTAVLLPNGKVLVTGGGGGIGGVGFDYLATAELYDPDTGTWTRTGKMSEARQLHTATVLPNGKVLIAGGFQGGVGGLASAELYDPQSGTWSPTGSMSTPRHSHTTTLLPNGKVLVAGGGVATAELYDPATGMWEPTNSMNDAREGHIATLLPNGKVLVARGNVGTDELYDVVTGTWTNAGPPNFSGGEQTVTLLATGQVLAVGGQFAELYTPAMPGTPGTWTPTGAMVTAGTHRTATVLPNGKVLVAGGSGSVPLPATELYEPATGAWTANGNLLVSRSSHTATRLTAGPNAGKVLIAGGAGGSGDLTSAELYDPGSGVTINTGKLITARHGHRATLLPNGQVLVAGGCCLLTASAELYDPATGMWSVTRSMTTARVDHVAVLLPNGKVMVAGGTNASGALDSAELYDPQTGTWSSAGRMLSARARGHGATLLPNGKVLVAGGFVDPVSASGALASAELYDPDSNAWVSTEGLAVGRGGHAQLLLPNGKVLVAGGRDASNSSLGTAFLYDPVSGRWSQMGNLGEARDHHIAVVLFTGQVLVGGGTSSPSDVSLRSAELFSFSIP